MSIAIVSLLVLVVVVLIAVPILIRVVGRPPAGIRTKEKETRPARRKIASKVSGYGDQVGRYQINRMEKSRIRGVRQRWRLPGRKQIGV